jgi:hypothetical protein
MFNITNRANFNNPSGDERLATTFLVLERAAWRRRFPRQAKLGIRYAF